MALTREEGRTARVLFAEELAEGRVAMEDLRRPEVEVAVRSRPVPSGLSRRLQARAAAAGRLGFVELAAPLAAARDAVLGPAADGPPRVLLGVGTVDAHARADVEALAALHGRLEAFGAGALVGVGLGTPPALPDPPTAAILGALVEHGLELGLLVGAQGAGAREGLAILGAVAGRPAQVAVVGPGVLRARDWAGLARHVDVVAGPADIATFGAHPVPAFRGRAVSAVAHGGLTGAGQQVATAIGELASRRWALWTPVWVDWQGGRAAAEVLATASTSSEGVRFPRWSDLLTAVALARLLPDGGAEAPNT